MKLRFDYSEEKNLILQESRQVSFSDIINAIERGKKLDDLAHTNKKRYPNQRLFVMDINGYAYVVPYVVDKKRKKLFLKTLYPSRKLTNKYLGKKI